LTGDGGKVVHSAVIAPCDAKVAWRNLFPPVRGIPGLGHCGNRTGPVNPAT
jgi:hypothetical protein